jgi:hypothetical protein
MVGLVVLAGMGWIALSRGAWAETAPVTESAGD